MTHTMFRLILGVVLAVAAPLASAQAGGVTEASMRAYYEAWSKGDVDTIMTHFSEDIVYSDVATGARASGSVEVRAFAQKFVDENPGVALKTASITIGTKSAAVEWVMSGGTGDEAWSVPGVCVFDLEGDKISRATDYWNKE